MADITNFGGNVRFRPQVCAAPRSEEEVLELLRIHRGKRFRAVGRLHSWSEAPRTDEVLVDLRHLDQVWVERHDQGARATIGGGCQVKHILAELECQAGLTLPSMGLITEQTVAGAISTGTHGSGRHSMSHYVVEVRLANYDPASGEPRIQTLREGEALRAARCSVGSLGIILSVQLHVRPQYQVEEQFRGHTALADVLAAEEQFPIQQFYFVPWWWHYLAQHRREVSAPRSRLASLYRAYCFVTLDVTLHLATLFLVRILRSRFLVKGFLRYVAPYSILRGWRVVDKSQRQLIMEHELFRHIEIELFVTRSRLENALTFAREVIECFDGNPAALSHETRRRLEQVGLLKRAQEAAGTYSHHYVICVRKVLPDDTLLSMASGGDEPHYALSFISYAHPTDRAGFFRFASFMGDSMAALFDARPHWGKVCPLTAAQIAALYPGLPTFQSVCQDIDPAGVFRSRWTGDVLFSNQADNRHSDRSRQANFDHAEDQVVRAGPAK